METIKQLASFAVINVNGGQRVTFTYDEIDPDTGEVLPEGTEGELVFIHLQFLPVFEHKDNKDYHNHAAAGNKDVGYIEYRKAPAGYHICDETEAYPVYHI